ncbi:copper amine oxidase N-terminal domain-containing protein [Sporanaerobacter acetigenes]|uniref:Copper amine oxidase N-terminal domain-containing protein n=1 Tax=Sporanaerobacter acetigenes DSM 13106 TaxID=1123281 RepID=A0A1M5UUU8_9FIRM|nr:copper amine oxidase N-terminal domain-containing protein [Sporanaerobacter acetigenes]SHH66523.1 Copper amine oxidase N-terminal domain-containing protein [Sporanaerobacter acetigenes DSM 13106]
MKLKLPLFIAILVIVVILLNRFYTNSKVESTNISYLNIRFDEEQPIIEYYDGSEEMLNLKENVFLFFNGSVVEGAIVKIVDGEPIVPTEVISTLFNAKIKENDNEDIISVTLKGKKIDLFINEKYARVNNENYTLDIETQKIEDKIYVPLKFISEQFGAKFNYYDGENIVEGQFPILPNYKQIMINKYPTFVEPLSNEEALAILRKELEKAYETVYGKKYESYKGNLSDKNLSEEDGWRNFISNKLYIKGENDRYYIIPVVFDFFVDKYTGDVYVFYQGANYVIYKFDPYSKDAFSFAG